jgi:23S rRNA (cytidine1920-2'-O)/16S rRNA (cytidine1409-2'-O)-methyltransferase
MKQDKERIDKLLVDRGLAPTRTKAQALVMAGVVLVNEKRAEKPSEMVDRDAGVRLKGDAQELRYVSRAGLKLEAALAAFHIRVHGYVCLDVGSSTGGFTDCLLQHGAKHVVAVDTGTNQMVWKLRQDPRVDVHENTNARYLSPEDFEQLFDLAVVDVSFISATLILKPAASLLRPGARLVVLIKPQFEAGKGEVEKGGVIRDPAKQQAAVEKVNTAAEAVGFEALGVIESPILGAAGNREFLAAYVWQGERPAG